MNLSYWLILARYLAFTLYLISAALSLPLLCPFGEGKLTTINRRVCTREFLIAKAQMRADYGELFGQSVSRSTVRTPLSGVFVGRKVSTFDMSRCEIAY